jgi:hypothetical protein
MENPFQREGRRGTVYARRARQPMVEGPAEKAIREQAEQLKHYNRWKRQVEEGVRRGEYADWLNFFVKNVLIPLPEPSVILFYVQNAPWMINADDATREVCLGYISEAITRWRIRHGLPSYDDGFYDEPPSEFVLIRRLLTKEGV